jgi:predicted NBD/HSP70 family sugar kinase
MQVRKDHGQPATEDAGVFRGSNQAGMRAHNERLVLTLIRRLGPTAKADVARATGLSAQTVSVIMRALEQEGLLERGEPVRGRVGQPSVPMALAAEGAFFFGMKVGRRSLELVLIDFLGQVVASTRQSHPYPVPGAIVAFAHSGIAELMAQIPADHRDRIAGMGIAMPFRMWDWAEALGVPAEAMAGWRTADLAAEIGASYDFPVYLQNDASAACAAELVFGRSETPQDFVYFFVGYFIGGGVVLNGALYPGHSGNAGALGSLPVPGPEGRLVQLIDVASLSWLEERLDPQVIDPATLWQDLGWLEGGGAEITRWLETAARGIAHAIASAVSVIDFEAVLIDGWMPPDMRERLVDLVRRETAAIAAPGISWPEIAAGTIGPGARALGAASLPLSERFMVEAGALQ